MKLFRMVELEEGMPVQFVGNYVLRANEPPKYGFIEVDERDDARRWAAAWKRKAKQQRWLINAKWHWCNEAEAERDAARAQLVTASDNEADAVQRAQEAERELREARAELDAVRNALPIVWRAFDALYGAKHKQPIPYDSLPKDRQELFDAALDALAELNEDAPA